VFLQQSLPVVDGFSAHSGDLSCVTAMVAGAELLRISSLVRLSTADGEGIATARLEEPGVGVLLLAVGLAPLDFLEDPRGGILS